MSVVGTSNYPSVNIVAPWDYSVRARRRDELIMNAVCLRGSNPPTYDDSLGSFTLAYGMEGR